MFKQETRIWKSSITSGSVLTKMSGELIKLFSFCYMMWRSLLLCYVLLFSINWAVEEFLAGSHYTALWQHFWWVSIFWWLLPTLMTGSLNIRFQVFGHGKSGERLNKTPHVYVFSYCALSVSELQHACPRTNAILVFYNSTNTCEVPHK